MKQIVIYQENSSPILIEDEDDAKIEEYSKKLVTLLESNNVSILHTSKSSVIIRPNKISSIVINELKTQPKAETMQMEVKKPEKTEETEDIITD